MRHTIRQAAEIAGISRKTLYAHVKQGKISAQTDHSGSKVIDHAELIRVYGRHLKTPEAKPIQEKTSGDQDLHKELARYKQHVAVLLANNKALREQNSLLKSLVLDAKEREKNLSERYEKTMSIFERLLPAERK